MQHRCSTATFSQGGPKAPMARISTTELERLKREVAVERLAEARGIALVRKGADLVGPCPFQK